MICNLLIANRGEVAGRIISTCRRLGIRTVAVYSEADKGAPHVRMAHQAVLLGPAPAAESYLNIEAILKAAEITGADAVHPGYGFLAENAEFARRVREAGLIFVGPQADVIEQMGSKVAARAICEQAGVPTVPGCRALPDEELLGQAEEIGFPVMLKASAGGGGKGMRRLKTLDELREALPSARREALKAFGSDEVYLERALVHPRHLEVQIVGDGQGRVIHLGVRECSLQRRHQKIIEESPPVNVSRELLKGLSEAAVRLAQAVNYSSLGTVEFLVSGDEFFFLEMNTRLQVEHPVTEMITGLDLVELQLEIAQGERLGIVQSEVRFRGHSIEARITCEDPYNNFFPATGTVLDWRGPARVRIDACLEAGSEVTPHYDSMVAKLIVWGRTREVALRSLQGALQDTVLLGVTSNIDFLRRLAGGPEMLNGRQHTELVDSLNWERPEPTVNQVLAAAAARYVSLAGGTAEGLGAMPVELGFEGGSVVTVHKGKFHLNEEEFSLEVEPGALTVNGHRFPVVVATRNGEWWAHTPDGTACLKELERLPLPGTAGGAGSLNAPMPGSVVEVLVKPGDAVTEGQALLKMEAMKMEQTVSSPRDGVVESVHFGVGEQVEAGATLVSLAEKA